jgi:hypothetical protein
MAEPLSLVYSKKHIHSPGMPLSRAARDDVIFLHGSVNAACSGAAIMTGRAPRPSRRPLNIAFFIEQNGNGQASRACSVAITALRRADRRRSCRRCTQRDFAPCAERRGEDRRLSRFDFPCNDAKSLHFAVGRSARPRPAFARFAESSRGPGRRLPCRDRAAPPALLHPGFGWASSRRRAGRWGGASIG